MRILIYSPNFSPELTGTGKYNGEMAQWLGEKGHSVDVITGLPYYPEWEIKKGYQGFSKECNGNVTIYRSPLYVPAPNKVSLSTRVLLQTSFTFTSLKYWLSNFFSRKSYDAVIAICPPLQTAVFPFFYRLFRKKPFIIHVQDLEFDAAIRLGIVNSNFFSYLFNSIEKFFLKKANRVSTITPAMKKRIIEKGVTQRSTFLFPNWSDISYIQPLELRNNRFRKELGIKDDQVLFMYAGNIGEKQGLDIVIDVALDLNSDSMIQFVIAGEGAAKEKLLKMAKSYRLNNIRFLPVQPLEKLPELLAAADVHLVIQKSEAADLVMPSKLTNILAAGRPALATADQGTALYEVINNYKIGMTSSPGNMADLIEKIKKLSVNHQERKQMGINAREYAEKYLDKDSILKEFERNLLSLVNNKDK